MINIIKYTLDKNICIFIDIISNKYNIPKYEIEKIWYKDTIFDKYTKDILKNRYTSYVNMYKSDKEFIDNGFNIRHQNMPEDISENIVKFIIKKYEGDETCIWCKCIDKKYKISGDLYSNKGEIIEVKSFTSNGPIQFGPYNKFDILYFLDLRNFINNKIILWRVNLCYQSEEFLSIKINNNQTINEQFKQGRRPRINWNKLYPQIKNFCEKIYEDSFENIF